jgi:membrane-associated protein
VTLAGHGLGRRIPNVDRYLLPIVAVIVVVSLIPVGLGLLRTRRERRSSISSQPPAERTDRTGA